MDRKKILSIFEHYKALNADFVDSVEKREGKNWDSYSVLSKEVDDYADGPFHDALAPAEKRVCRFKDEELLKAFFQVILATRNSADEQPSFRLGSMFLCQPKLIEHAFKALPPEDQKEIYGALEWGFEMAVNKKPKDDKNVSALRRKLDAMKPIDYPPDPPSR